MHCQKLIHRKWWLHCLLHRNPGLFLVTTRQDFARQSLGIAWWNMPAIHPISHFLGHPPKRWHQ